MKHEHIIIHLIDGKVFTQAYFSQEDIDYMIRKLVEKKKGVPFKVVKFKELKQK